MDSDGFKIVREGIIEVQGKRYCLRKVETEYAYTSGIGLAAREAVSVVQHAGNLSKVSNLWATILKGENYTLLHDFPASGCYAIGEVVKQKRVKPRHAMAYLPQPWARKNKSGEYGMAIVSRVWYFVAMAGAR